MPTRLVRVVVCPSPPRALEVGFVEKEAEETVEPEESTRLTTMASGFFTPGVTPIDIAMEAPGSMVPPGARLLLPWVKFMLYNELRSSSLNRLEGTLHPAKRTARRRG